MIERAQSAERDGVEWASPLDAGRRLGINPNVVRGWIRDGLLAETGDERTEVRRAGRNGRYLYVRMDAAERTEQTTRHKGRPRSST